MYRNRKRTRPSVVSGVDLQTLGAEIRIYGEIDDPAMRYMNPSIAWHNGELKIAIRKCNFGVERYGKWYLRDGSAYSKTDVIYGDLDPKTLEVSNLEKLELSKDSPTRILVSGLEDVRLFARKNGMYAVGFESDRVTRSLHNKSTAMAEYLIEGSTLVYCGTLRKPDPTVVEKNWSPTSEHSELFDYTYSDSQVYKDGKLIGKPTATQIHGGSQLLLQKDGTWLSIVHEKELDPQFDRFSHGVYDKYVYKHYLAWHGKDGIITHLSKPFNFGTHENIEFAAGMAEGHNDFIISFGIRDCKYAIAKIRKDKLISLFGGGSDVRE